MKNCENCEHYQSCYNWCKKHLVEIKQDTTLHKCYAWEQKKSDKRGLA